MGINSCINGNAAHITISGRFDYQLHREFKEAYSPLIKDENVREIGIELSLVDYLDSSALGMLMLLNERASNSHKSVTLFNPSGVASHVLDVANFSEVFTITHSGSAAKSTIGR
jgi:anti-anti-sigma factor